MKFPEIISRIKRQTKGYWAERAALELEYAAKVSLVDGGAHDALIEKAADALFASFTESGAVAKADCLAMESALEPMAARAKSFGQRFIGHAHIDMNWMWSYAETVEVALESFRTILRLMDEFPGFTFAQSQASVYKIVELHEPEMLDRIREKIREGRWEVTASTWVEADKNMSSEEAMARHLLYTREYLKPLLGLTDDDFRLDFEPDTFGHSRNVPTILNAAGVKYYYHCRSLDEDYSVYRWRAPSGAELLVNREKYWYGVWALDAGHLLSAPEFCTKYGVPYSFEVYGVGDHGGGPTKRDVTMIIDMKSWPIFPNIDFGTYKDYYAELEKVRASLPVVDHEINPRFTGCYTTQSRIKALNAIGERRLGEADVYGAMAAAFGGGFRPVSMERAWENVLFNQFHDILPGSGVIETREYASGIAQQSFADANTAIAKAMRAVAERIDTSSLPHEDADEDFGGYSASRSDGGGVGFRITSLGLPTVERGRGVNRIYQIFNRTQDEYAGLTEISMWDWPGDIARIVARGADGAELPIEVLPVDDRGAKTNEYWGHAQTRFVVAAKIPAFGYTTVAIGEKELQNASVYPVPADFGEKPLEYALENSRVRVVLDPVTFGIVSMIDKADGRELASKSRPAGLLRVVTEDNNGMEAWHVGKYAEIKPARRARIISYNKGALRQSLKYSVELAERSRATVELTLDKDSARVKFHTNVTWLEDGSASFLPQLSAYFPFGYECASYTHAVPMGMLARAPRDNDMPCLGFAAAKGVGHPVYVSAASKYGFRCFDDAIALDLLRSATNPDTHPELGDHAFDYSFGIAPSADAAELEREKRLAVFEPAYVTNSVHAGELPLESGAFGCSGAVVSGVKLSEDGKAFVARVYDVAGGGKVKLGFPSGVKSASLCDIHEDAVTALGVSGGKVSFEMKPYSVATVRAEL